MSKKERLQKVMAHAGVDSRRACEKIIEEGRVKVNGETVSEPGFKVNLGQDNITVDGVEIEKEELVYYLLNKPTGYVTTVKDPHGRPAVIDLVEGAEKRIYPVGRLDLDSSGLLLLTNDGQLTHIFTHPSFEIKKIYEVVINDHLSPAEKKKLENGINLDEGKTSPSEVTIIEKNMNKTKFNIELHEGWNRQIRRMCGKLGKNVISLKRLTMGPLSLEGLEEGDYRALNRKELSAVNSIINNYRDS